MDDSHHNTKAGWTVWKRRIHYFIFCFLDLKQTDDWRLKNKCQERCNYQFALYATHLATGSTLHCRFIKSSKIQTYLRDVAEFIGRFCDIDPRYRSTANTGCAPAISKGLNEVKRWETVPNKREPFTLETQFYIATKAAQNPDDCCIEASLANWTLCTMYTGRRGIEWIQTNSKNTPLNSNHGNRFGNANEFTLEDVQCKTQRTNFSQFQKLWWHIPKMSASSPRHLRNKRMVRTAKRNYSFATTLTNRIASSQILCKSWKGMQTSSPASIPNCLWVSIVIVIGKQHATLRQSMSKH